VSYPQSANDPQGTEALREALRDAQRRLAYFERFGTLIQDQMAGVVERATQISEENERERNLMSDEVSRLRAEAESLRRQADYQRSQAEATISRANQDAAALLRQVHDATRSLVETMVARLESLQREVTSGSLAASEVSGRSGGAVSAPAPPPSPVPTPYESRSSGLSNGIYGSMAVPPPPPVPPSFSIPSSPVPEPSQSSAASTTTTSRTRLVVHPVMSYEELIRFQQSLRDQPGVEHVEISAISDERCEMVVSHEAGTSLETSLQQVSGRSLRITGRSSDVIEVEVAQSDSVGR